MTPDLSHIDHDAVDTKHNIDSSTNIRKSNTNNSTRSSSTSINSVNDNNNSTNDKKRNTKASLITSHYVKSETEKALAYKKLTYDHYIRGLESLPWQSLAIHDKNSQHAQIELNKLYGGNEANNKESWDTLHMSKKWFLNFLYDNINKKELSLLEQVKILMKRAQILPFSLILQYFQIKSRDKMLELLHTVSSICYLIHGIFIYKEEINMNLNTSIFRLNLLLLLAKYQAINKELLYKNMNIEHDLSTAIINQLAKHEDSQIKLKYDKDDDFIKTFPQIVQYHQNQLDKLNEKYSFLI